MAGEVSRAVKYFMKKFEDEVDQNADPHIQIQQAITAAQEQHEKLGRQSVAVLELQRQAERELQRQLDLVNQLQSSVRQKLTQADGLRKTDPAGADTLEREAQAAATQLVSAERMTCTT